MKTLGSVVLAASLLSALPGCSTNPPPQGYDCAQQGTTGITLNDLARLRSGRFIVLLRRPIGLSAMDVTARQQQVASFAAQFRGLTRVETFVHTVYGFAAEVDEPAQVLRLLLERPEVRSIHPVVPMSIPEPLQEEGPAAVSSWGLDRTDQRDLPLDGEYEPGADGAGVVVGILDTGILPAHPDYAGRVESEFFDHAGGGARDDHGHGSHVAGTVAGSQFGIAKAARLVSVKVLTGGTGDDAGVIGGIDWFTDFCVRKGLPCVGNMSLGGGKSTPLGEAVCRSLAAGVTWAVAAGNDNEPACAGSPSDVKQALVAGATNRADDRASFSNQGECVSVFAPGQDITSAWLSGQTRTISGTSMASPHVAGVAALVLAEQPNTSPAAVKLEVVERASADKLSGLAPGSPNLLLFYRKPN